MAFYCVISGIMHNTYILLDIIDSVTVFNVTLILLLDYILNNDSKTEDTIFCGCTEMGGKIIQCAMKKSYPPMFSGTVH